MKFHVVGKPVTQGSMRAMISKSTGYAIAVHDKRPELLSWREAVRMAALRARDGGLIHGPVAVTAHFYILPPASRPATLRTDRQREVWSHPWRKPDLDKLGRGLLDALVGVVIADDAQVVSLSLGKQYADEPGATIEVEALT